MRWTPGGRSKDLEDMRGASPGGGGFRGGGRIGLGGLVVLLVLSVVFKKDFLSGAIDGGGGVPSGAIDGPPAAVQDSLEEGTVQFLSMVLDSAQDGWARKLQGYQRAKLALFRNEVSSACGYAEAATGPFYCPGDQKVYIDLGFFDQLDRQFGAPGDFAQAYVLAHEIGHHVQNLMGTERELRSAQQRNPELKNQLSVAMELQADCYAGVWAFSAARNNQLEPGDLNEGLSAAAAVGDDRLQKMGGGRVQPESFTHGSSADRQRWFNRGFESGDPRQCDTFAGMR